MKMKMKNGSHRYDIIDLGLGKGTNIVNIKSVTVCHMLISIEQHLSNIWGSINEKVKQHWGWVEKKALLIKKRVTGQNQPSEVFYKKGVLKTFVKLAGKHLC